MYIQYKAILQVPVAGLEVDESVGTVWWEDVLDWAGPDGMHA